MDQFQYDGAWNSDAPADPGRRRFFIGATALGAAVATGAPRLAKADPPATSERLRIGESLAPGPSRFHPSFVKDVGLLTDLNATNQGGAWWNFDTYITPVEQFYIRNEYATPRAEIDKRVDPRFWRLKIHGDAVERPIEIGYEDDIGLAFKMNGKPLAADHGAPVRALVPGPSGGASTK